MTCIFLLLTTSFVISKVAAWQALPEIPTGRRSQYLVLQDNGAYKYGYDTGDGSAAKQSGDSSNQVEGHYFYTSPTGRNIDLKYSAGVQGFVPESPDKVISGLGYQYPVPSAHSSATTYSINTNEIGSPDDQAGTGDASYSFSIDTDSYKRHESSDARGNIQGSYSYANEAGVHNLQYIAGENTGFVATSGSLSTPNGLVSGQTLPYYGAASYRNYQSPPSSRLGYAHNAPSIASSSHNVPIDGSYSFSYSAGDSSRQESSDSSGNIQGRYSYQNDAGTHDLSYVAGAQTGFLPTGGSLSIPNGLKASPSAFKTTAVSTHSGQNITPLVVNGLSSAAAFVADGSSPDGSYSFSYSTGDQSRQESRDSSGNVEGKYAYQNGAGTHDLSYIAGSKTGFQVTGGSLSQPNGLRNVISPIPSPLALPGQSYLPPVTVALARQSSFDSSSDNEDDQANTGDASYSFTIDTDEYKRKESSDANGNVQGSFSYKNGAGSHDLNFVAGSATGFQPTGGSLKTPPGLNEAQLKFGASHDKSGYSAKSSVFSQSYDVPLMHSQNPNSIVPTTKSSYRLGNAVVHTYLPPENDKKKYGYIYDTA